MALETESLRILDAYGFIKTHSNDEYDVFVLPPSRLVVRLYNDGSWKLYNHKTYRELGEPRASGDGPQSLNGRLSRTEMPR